MEIRQASPRCTRAERARNFRPPAAALAMLASLSLLPASALAGVRRESPQSPPATAEAHGVRGQRCRPSIEVGSTLLSAGETVAVTGTLQCPEGVEAGGQTVTLFSRSPGAADGFAPVGSATSEPDGAYQITSPALDANTIFYVRAAGGHSARRRVLVTPEVSLVAPADGTELRPGSRDGSVVATNTVTFAGTVTPAAPGELVVLQRESPSGSGRWRRIAVARTDEAGHYAITHTFHRAGEATVRVLVRSRGVLALAASEPLRYTIAARPARVANRRRASSARRVRG